MEMEIGVGAPYNREPYAAWQLDFPNKKNKNPKAKTLSRRILE